MKKTVILILSIVGVILLLGSFPLKLIAGSVAVDSCRLAGFVLLFVVLGLRISPKEESSETDAQECDRRKKAGIVRAVTIALILTCILGSIGYQKAKEMQKGDYPAAIMVEDVLYYLADAMPAEIDESAISGYTTSYTDGMPQKNGETNFNRELNMPYAKVSDGIAVLYEQEWWLCRP